MVLKNVNNPGSVSLLSGIGKHKCNDLDEFCQNYSEYIKKHDYTYQLLKDIEITA